MPAGRSEAPVAPDDTLRRPPRTHRAQPEGQAVEARKTGLHHPSSGCTSVSRETLRITATSRSCCSRKEASVIVGKTLAHCGRSMNGALRMCPLVKRRSPRSAISGGQRQRCGRPRPDSAKPLRVPGSGSAAGDRRTSPPPIRSQKSSPAGLSPTTTRRGAAASCVGLPPVVGEESLGHHVDAVGTNQRRRIPWFNFSLSVESDCRRMVGWPAGRSTTRP